MTPLKFLLCKNFGGVFFNFKLSFGGKKLSLKRILIELTRLTFTGNFEEVHFYLKEWRDEAGKDIVTVSAKACTDKP